MVSLLAFTCCGFSHATEEQALHVAGGSLRENGHLVAIRGVEIPSLESSNDGEHVFRSVRVAIEDWGANCVQIPVCQDRWFGKAPGQNGSGDAYRTSLDEIASYVSRSNAYMVLDLAWSDSGELGKDLGPHPLPNGASVRFWKEAAHKFRGNSRVMFLPFEPSRSVETQLWLDGGAVSDANSSYNGIGIRLLIREIRSVGAKNVLLLKAPGSGWSDTWALKDSNGRGLLAGVDLGDGRTGSFGDAAPIYWLSAADGVRAFDAVKPGCGWIAKSLGVTGASAMVSDWTYRPQPGWGAAVIRALKAGRSSDLISSAAN